MHQLGLAKRTVESIRSIVKSDNRNFEIIAWKLGGALSRNSDRCFPRMLARRRDTDSGEFQCNDQVLDGEILDADGNECNWRRLVKV